MLAKGSVATLIFGLVISLVGCEQAPDLNRPGTYAKNGIEFSFPGNWTVTEDVSETGETDYRTIVVESNLGAIVIIQRFSPKIEWTLEEFAAEHLASILENAKDSVTFGPLKPISAEAGESSNAEALISGVVRNGVKLNFTLSALGTPVPHHSTLFRLDEEDAALFLISQAAAEDWSKVSPGFGLIASTLSLEPPTEATRHPRVVRPR